MKYLILAFCVLCSNFALAGGRLVLRPIYEKADKAEGGTWRYSLALPVRQKLPVLPLSYVGTYSLVHYQEDKRLDYLRTEQGLDMAVGAATIGAGASFEYNPHRKSYVQGYYGNLSLTLWD
jgi:hypothetical protein